MMKNSASIATAAKIHVMYGKRITPSMYNDMLKMSSVYEIGMYLKASPAYARDFSGTDPSFMHRGYLEGIIRKGFFTQQLKIAGAACGIDKKFLQSVISRYETQQLLSFMRYLRGGRQEKFLFDAPDYICEYSKLNFKEFSHCTDYREFYSKIASTEYGKILRGYVPEEDSDLSLFENLLFTHFYSKQWGLVGEFDKKTKILVGASLGAEVDILNITHILRLKKYYHLGEEATMGHIIPYYHAIPRQLLKQIAAADYDGAVQIIKGTAYGGLFENIYDLPELSLPKFMYKFSKRIMTSTFSTVAVPIAYFNLKDIETRNLITIIEGKRYGLGEDAIRERLIGI